MNNSRRLSSLSLKADFILYGMILFSAGFYGTAMRLIEYLANRSIWLDEVSLALNITEKSLYEIATQPLSYDQAAPLGFLLLTKLLTLAWGTSEYALRFVPLITSLLSLFLFYKFLINCGGKRSALIAFILFAVSSELIRYATEFKQYSSDIFCVLILALYGQSFLNRKLTFRESIILGLAGGVIIWFSFPAVFFLGGIGLVLLSRYGNSKDGQSVRNLCGTFILWGMSFSVMYFCTLRPIGSNMALEKYWYDEFMPLPPYSLNDQYWFISSFIGMFYYPGMISQALLAAIAFIIGSVLLFKKARPVFFLLLIPIILTLIASAFHRYPFGGRVLLFYVPFLYFLIAQGIMFLSGRSSIFPRLLGIISLFTILLAPLALACQQVSHRMFYSEEIKPVLKYVQAASPASGHGLCIGLPVSLIFISAPMVLISMSAWKG